MIALRNKLTKNFLTMCSGGGRGCKYIKVFMSKGDVEQYCYENGYSEEDLYHYYELVEVEIAEVFPS